MFGTMISRANALRSRAKQLHLAFYQAVRTTPRLVSNQKVRAAAICQHPDAVHVPGFYKKIEYDGDIRRSGHREFIAFFADQLFPWIAKEFAETVGHINVPSIRIDDHDVLGPYVCAGPRP
jgi:hypothetical protein